MQYYAECRCGALVAVKAEDAGSTVRCDCGENVAVPSLSKLRTTVGIGSYESGAIDAVQRMLAEGTLPWGETCAVSGRPTRDVILINVQCEQLAPPKDPVKFALLLAMCAGPWATLILFSKPDQTHGRDTAMIVPLRVCREYHRV